MDISNYGGNQGSWYVNPNTRSLTSNRKNTAIKDRDNFDCMKHLPDPVEDMMKVIKTPINLADRTSINRAANTVTIAEGTRIQVNDGYILTVKKSGVELSHGANYDPYDTAAYKRAQGLANSLTTLLRNAGGTQRITASSQEGYQKWTSEVSTVLSYMGLDGNRDFTVNGMKYSKNAKGYWESAANSSAKAAYEREQAANRTYTYADERTRNQIDYISNYYLDNVSAKMQTAWQKALEETGINPFPEEFSSTLSQLAMEQDFATGGNDDIFGKDAKSNAEAVQKIIDRIDNPLGAVSEKDQNFRANEKTFYTAVLEHMTSTEAEKEMPSVTGDKAAEYAEKAFASVGSKAPEEVKKAWMDAAKETGANGLGIGSNGMMTHISQMMIQRLKKSWQNGGMDDHDILGSSVSSAIIATRQALYDLENPLTPENTRSIEVQRMRIKEKEFYQSFLEKLEKIQAAF